MKLRVLIINDYSDIINKIYSVQENYDKFEEIKPRIIEYSSEAKIKFIEWVNFNADLMNEYSKNEAIVSMFSKLEIYISRLAMILQAIYFGTENDTYSSISLRAVKGAIKLIEYFRMNAIKVYLTINEENIRIDKLQVKDKVMELVKRGYSNVNIAKQIGKSEGTIRNWRKEIRV